MHQIWYSVDPRQFMYDLLSLVLLLLGRFIFTTLVIIFNNIVFFHYY